MTSLRYPLNLARNKAPVFQRWGNDKYYVLIRSLWGINQNRQ